MDNINQTVLIAIISSLSALLGSLIPLFVSYITEKSKRNNELRKELLSKQKEVYQQSIYAIQNILNNNSPDHTYALQKAILDVSIYGDDETSMNLNNYFNEIVDGSTGAKPALTTQRHDEFQLLIINSIRKRMGFKNLQFFRIIGYNPQG